MHPKNKAELLEFAHTERKKVEEKISGLTPQELVYQGTMGEWSVKDILQHLVDWEQRWISWYDAGKRLEDVQTPAPGYNWRQLGLLNEASRQKHLNRPLDEVLADFQASYQQIMAIIEQIPEEEMLQTGLYPWTGRLPLIDWINGNTGEHYQWAANMIHPIAIRRKMNPRGYK